ncbi:MAG: hypothetical protein ABIV50_06625, partial [Opitutus sp.]
FWTALLAAYFFDVVWGVAIVIVVPLVNYAITGLPDSTRVLTITLELAAYVVVTAGLIKVLGNSPVGPPLLHLALWQWAPQRR